MYRVIEASFPLKEHQKWIWLALWESGTVWHCKSLREREDSCLLDAIESQMRRHVQGSPPAPIANVICASRISFPPAA